MKKTYVIPIAKAYCVAPCAIIANSVIDAYIYDSAVVEPVDPEDSL